MKICAIVLAAGQSRRMGVHKLLLPFGGTTVIEHIIRVLRQSAVDDILVVVGHRADAVIRRIVPYDVTVVANPEYESGMLSSVRCGLRALPKGCDGVLIALGDQPGITAPLVDSLIGAFRAGERGIVVPVHKGKRGHPLLFAVRYKDEILAQYDAVGLRGLLHAHPDAVGEVATPVGEALADMDDPQGYRRRLESHDETT